MAHWWENYPWRVVQTNLREIDMADMDAARYVSDLKGLHANCVLLNAAGILASYPTKVPDHVQSEYLTGDSLSTVVDLCHQNGIKVIARTDFSRMRREVYERHPDWAYREPDGSIMDDNDNIRTCLCGGFQREFMEEVLTELLTAIPFDGIYCNMGGFLATDYHCKLHPICHCVNCQREFKARTGFDLPEADFPFAKVPTPALMAYQKFKAEIQAEQKKRIAALIRKINPEIAYCSVDYVREESNSEYGRGLPHWQYSASSNARSIRGMGKPATVADVDQLGFAMRYASTTPAQQELRLWQTVANLGGPDFFIMGRLDQHEDREPIRRAERVFAFLEKHESLFLGASSLADTLLVRESYKMPDAAERGWVRLLTESHVSFDETLSSGLAAMDLTKYKTIVLPNKGRLNPAVCEKLNGFAEAGGTVLCVGQPPMEGGKPLRCLGLESVGKPESDLGAYLALERDRELFPNLCGRIPVGKSYFPAAAGEGTETYFTLYPHQRFGPPEVAYPVEDATPYFGLSVHSHGAGRGVYLPWDPGVSHYNEGYDLWARFTDSLLDLLGVARLSRTLTPMVELTYGKKDGAELLQFVNGTGHFGVSFFEPVELHDAEAVLPWEGGFTCESLIAPDNVSAELSDGKLHIKVNKLGFYECIVIHHTNN